VRRVHAHALALQLAPAGGCARTSTGAACIIARIPLPRRARARLALDGCAGRCQPMLAELATLPPGSLVLDVGGGAAHDARADWVIDIEPWERRNWFYTDRGERPPFHDRVPRTQWVQRDICDRDPWPFPDGQFAFAICSQTLEDVRDPVWVCQEMMRVAQAGWIATPAAVTELTRGIESSHWCGWRHHRWL